MRRRYSYIAIGREFASKRAGCSLSLSSRLGTCDSLHVTNLALDVVSIAGRQVGHLLWSSRQAGRLLVIVRQAGRQVGGGGRVSGWADEIYAFYKILKIHKFNSKACLGYLNGFMAPIALYKSINGQYSI